MNIPGYGTVWQFGNPRATGLLDGNVVVEEKIDGYQFAATVKNGRLFCRGKEGPVPLDTNIEPYIPTVRTFVALHKAGLLHQDVVYRGEAMAQAKAHRLPYGRQAKGHFVLWDVETARETRISWPRKVQGVASLLGVEPVPVYYHGPGSDVTEAMLLEWIERKSALGNCKVEGIVVKNYARRDAKGRQLNAKLVAHRFREVKPRDPSKGGVVAQLSDAYRTEARWEKAVQRLIARGELKHEPNDLPAIRVEVAKDVAEDAGSEIVSTVKRELSVNDSDAQSLLDTITHNSMTGIHEWYKRQLIAWQLED